MGRAKLFPGCGRTTVLMSTWHLCMPVQNLHRIKLVTLLRGRAGALAESLLTVCLNFLIYLKEMTAKASHRVSPEPGFPGFDFHRKFGSLEAVIWLLNTLVS